MERAIHIAVNGEFVRKDGKNAGVQGEANATALHITFSEEWREFGKRIIWRDALGENPVGVILHNGVAALTAGQDPLAFDTMIPAEPLALPGWCSFTIEGFRDSSPTAVAITVTDHLLVKVNDAYSAPAEPTPSQAQQLQAQLDQIVPTVSEMVEKAVGALEETEDGLHVWELWDPERTYLPLNKVSRLGSSYLCTLACVGADPALDVAVDGENGAAGRHWLLIAKKGDRGEMGLTGRTGPPGPQGIHGVAVSASGQYGFSVREDGHLICSYVGETAPNFTINNEGHLILKV